MVKVASYEEFGNIGSLNDLRHAAKKEDGKEGEGDLDGKRTASWVDLSMLVISGNGGDKEDEE
jgi:hypothetical protein